MTDTKQNEQHHSARDKASAAYETAREKAAHTVEVSRDRARDAAQRAADAVEGNPIGVIVGGVALGALVAAVLPRSQREKELLAPVGRRVGATATAALAAAKQAGRDELSNLGLTKDAAKDQAKALFSNLTKAASTAGKAAADAGRSEARGS